MVQSQAVQPPQSLHDDGTSLAKVLRAEPPSEADFAMGRALLEEHMEPVSDLTWDQLTSFIREEGWSARQFVDGYKRLLKGKTWVQPGDTKPRWVIGDWFKLPDVKVFPSHASAQRAYPGAQIEAYRAPGLSKPVFGVETEVGKNLPKWVDTVVRVPIEQELPRIAGKAMEGEDISGAIRDMKELMRAKLDAEQAQQTADRARAELDRMRQSRGLAITERDEAVQMLVAAEERIMELEMALAAVLAAMEEDRMAARAGAPQEDAEAWTPEINRLHAILDPEEPFPSHPTTDKAEDEKGHQDGFTAAERGRL